MASSASAASATHADMHSAKGNASGSPKVEISDSYVNPVARVLLAGALLPSNAVSPVQILSSHPELLELIFGHVRRMWIAALKIGDDCPEDGYKGVTRTGNGIVPSWREEDQLTEDILALVPLARIDRRHVKFPPPTGIMCNMLPFIAGDKSSMPPEYHGYLGLVSTCLETVPDEVGKIWYLTIHESEATSYAPQRRGGIHVEGCLAAPASCKRTPFWCDWGFSGGGLFSGGIFHASTVSGSCRMWNAQIPREPSDVLQEGCDLEHLRGCLNEATVAIEPESYELYWMTDATPHESLPLKPGTYRQYFRVVTSGVSVWWERHSTKNRLGVKPPASCKILTHSKFDAEPVGSVLE